MHNAADGGRAQAPACEQGSLEEAVGALAPFFFPISQSWVESDQVEKLN